jgi:hypothetical protein
MWRRVSLVRTDVSAEYVASIFRVEKYASERLTLNVQLGVPFVRLLWFLFWMLLSVSSWDFRGIYLLDLLVQSRVLSSSNMGTVTRADLKCWVQTHNQLRKTSKVTNSHFTLSIYITNKKKLRGLSPLANYTDRATAACRRSQDRRLQIEGAAWSAQLISTAVLSVF